MTDHKSSKPMTRKKNETPTGDIEQIQEAQDMPETPADTEDNGTDGLEESTEEAEKAEKTATTADGETTSQTEETDEETEKPKSFMQQLHDYVNAEEDEDEPLRLDFKSLVGGDSLLGLVRRNYLFLFVITCFTCINISLRYMMDMAQTQNSRYNIILTDRQYKALSVESMLKERTLSSHIERELLDSTMHVPTEQAYSLRVDDTRKED